MKALLLAAGFGTRLKPLTDNVPKCLIDIHGKPLLAYWLDMLISGGTNEILINTHYLSQKVEFFIKRAGYKKNVKLVYEDLLLGTAGTVKKNRSFFENNSLILIHADNLSKFNLNAFEQRHKTRPLGAEITMMTFKTDSPQTCGIVELNNEEVVIAFHEKKESPPGNLANGAVYIIEPSVIDYISNIDKEIIDFSTDVIPNFLGKIYTFHNDIYHRDIGNLESYERALQEFSSR